MELSREEMASALSSLGYEINRQWEFKLRRDEKTASAKINMNGSVHDFGSGWHGDLIALLQEYHSSNFRDFKAAKEEAERLSGIEVEIDFTKFEKNTVKKSEKPLPDSFMIPHRVDAKNNRQNYLHELKLLFQGEYENKNELACKWENILKVAEKYDIGFNKKSNRLIMPLRDIEGKIMTFWKYKKYGASFINDDGKEIKHRKVLYTKGREKPPFAIQDIKKFKEEPNLPIIITEGEKDALVALANGQRAICIGGAGSSKQINDEYLELFKGLNFIIAGDYDKAGFAFNNNLLEILTPIAKSVRVLNWEQKSQKDGFKLHPKFDLADYFSWKNNIANKRTVKVLVQQVITKEIEVELSGDEQIEDKDLTTLYRDGKTLYSKYIIKN